MKQKQYKETHFHLALLATCLVFMILLIKLIYPSTELQNYLMIGGWMIAMISINYVILFLFKKWYLNKKRRWLFCFIFLVLILIVSIATLRAGASLLGSAIAWQNRWLYLVIILLFTILALLVQALFVRFHNQCLDVNNQLLLKQQELAILKVQVNPHFLFNSLNNLAAVIMVDREVALDYTYKLSELIRFHVDIVKEREIEIREEISFIQNYLDIEKLRLGSRYDISFMHSIPDSSLLLPPLLLFPLVESALKMSQGIGANPVIKIHIEVSENNLRLEISNLLPLCPFERNLSENHFDDLKKRLAILFPGCHVFHIDQTDRIQRTELQIRFAY
jgi:hypothetical protein